MPERLREGLLRRLTRFKKRVKLFLGDTSGSFPINKYSPHIVEW
jgi:hypothetical protein